MTFFVCLTIRKIYFFSSFISRPRFQNPFRYVKPTGPNFSGAEQYSSYPTSPSRNPPSSNTTAFTNVNNPFANQTFPNHAQRNNNSRKLDVNLSVNAHHPYEPSTVQTNIFQSSQVNNPFTKEPQSNSFTNPPNTFSTSSTANTINPPPNPFLEAYIASTSIISSNDTYLSKRTANVTKNSYPVSTQMANVGNPSTTNTQMPTDNFNRQNMHENSGNSSSPLTKKQKLEMYMKKNEIRLKSKKRALRFQSDALMQQNLLRRKSGSQLPKSYDNNDSLENSINSSISTDDQTNTQKQKYPPRNKSSRSSIRSNNSIQDNLNLNVQFVLRKGREIVNKYNKGFNKETAVNQTDHETRTTGSNELVQNKLPNYQLSNNTASVDFRSHLKDLRKLNLTLNNSRKNRSQVGGVQLSESAQKLLRKTKPVRVKVSALSPKALDGVRKVSSDILVFVDQCEK